MSLEQDIITAFPSVHEEPLVSDEFIEKNENIMELDGSIDYFKIVSAYMLWCIKNKDIKLVDMHTVNALAEYGRTNIKDNDYFNFKWRCDEHQKAVVVEFMKWCKKEITTSEEEQIDRAIKHWVK